MIAEIFGDRSRIVILAPNRAPWPSAPVGIKFS
jgi:hypothetical protein